MKKYLSKPSRRDFLKLSAGAFLTIPHVPGGDFLEKWSELLFKDDPSLVDNGFLHRSLTQGIYVPGWKAVSRRGIDNLMTITRMSEINTLMIDVKNAWGEIFYSPKNPLAGEIGSQARTKEGAKVSLNFDYLLEQADKHQIRLIARHVMFRDENLFHGRPDLRLWEKNSEKWVDLRKKEVIDYNLSLLEEETNFGFQEIVLDYIRFPALRGYGTNEEKCETIDGIVARAGGVVKASGVDLGTQIYGYAAWHYRKAGVGQRISTLDPHVDVIYPMLYPSHFWPGSFGFANPSDHPYEIITLGYREAVKKIRNGTRIIPMIQAFWYSGEEIIRQLRAAYDHGMPGYVCWNPAGSYRKFQVGSGQGGMP